MTTPPPAKRQRQQPSQPAAAAQTASFEALDEFPSSPSLDQQQHLDAAAADRESEEEENDDSFSLDDGLTSPSLSSLPPAPPCTPTSSTSSNNSIDIGTPIPCYRFDDTTLEHAASLFDQSLGSIHSNNNHSHLYEDYLEEGAVTPAPKSANEASNNSRRNEIMAAYAAAAAAAAMPTPHDESVATLSAAAAIDQEAAAAAAIAATPSSGAASAQSHRHHARASATTASLPEDFSEWAVGDRYQLVRMLGRGSYGEVAQAKDLYYQPNNNSSDNTTTITRVAGTTTTGGLHEFVAIKRIQSPFDQEVDAVRLFREMHLLRRLRGHECIIQLIDVVQPPSDDLDDFHDLYLVFECKKTRFEKRHGPLFECTR